MPPVHPTYYIWPQIGSSPNFPWNHNLLIREGVYPMARILSSFPDTQYPPNDFSVSNLGPLPDFVSQPYDNGGLTVNHGFNDWASTVNIINAKAAALRTVQWIRYYQEGFSTISPPGGQPGVGRIFDNYSVFPQNWGTEVLPQQSSLFFNPLDSLVEINANITNSAFKFEKENLFTANGIAEVKTWSDEFISILDTEITVLALPIPTKFHFDMENIPGISGSIVYGNAGGDLLQNEEYGWWQASLADPRANTELIDGVNTLNQIIAAAKNIDGTPFDFGGLSFTSTGSIFGINVNHKFIAWISGIIRRVTDYAIHKAFFETAKATWPNIQWSNWKNHLSQPTLKTDLPEVDNASPGVNFVGAGIDKLYSKIYNISTLNADYQSFVTYPITSSALANAATNSGPQNWMDRYGVTKTADWKVDYTQYYHSSVKTSLRVIHSTNVVKPINIWITDSLFTRFSLQEIANEYANVGSAPNYVLTQNDINIIGSFAVLLGTTTDFSLWTGVDSALVFDTWDQLVVSTNAIWEAAFGGTSPGTDPNDFSTISNVNLEPLLRFVSPPDVFDTPVNLLPNPIEPLFDYLVDVVDQAGSRPIFAGFEMSIIGVPNSGGGNIYNGIFEVQTQGISILDLNNVAGDLTQLQKDNFKQLILDNISIVPGRTANTTEFTVGVKTIADQGIKTIKINAPLIDTSIDSAPLIVSLPYFSIDATSTTLSKFVVTVDIISISIDAGTIPVVQDAFHITKDPLNTTSTLLTAEIVSGNPNIFTMINETTISSLNTVMRFVQGNDVTHKISSNPTAIETRLAARTFREAFPSSANTQLDIEVSKRLNRNITAENWSIIAGVSLVPDGNLDRHVNQEGLGFSSFRFVQVDTEFFITPSVPPMVLITGVFFGDNDHFILGQVNLPQARPKPNNRTVLENVFKITNNSSKVLIIVIINTFDRQVNTPGSTGDFYTINNFTGTPGGTGVAKMNVSLGLTNIVYDLDYNEDIRTLFDRIEVDFLGEISFSIITYGEIGHYYANPEVGGSGIEVECYRKWPSTWLQSRQSMLVPFQTQMVISGGGAYDLSGVIAEGDMARNINIQVTGNDKQLGDLVRELKSTGPATTLNTSSGVRGTIIDVNSELISGWDNSLPLLFVSKSNGNVSDSGGLGLKQEILYNTIFVNTFTPRFDINASELGNGFGTSVFSGLAANSGLKLQISDLIPDVFFPPNTGLIEKDQIIFGQTIIMSNVLGLITKTTTEVVDEANLLLNANPNTNAIMEVAIGFETIFANTIVPVQDGIFTIFLGLDIPIDFQSNTGSVVTDTFSFNLDGTTDVQSMLASLPSIWGTVIDVQLFPPHGSTLTNLLNSPVGVADLLTGTFVSDVTVQQPVIGNFVYNFFDPPNNPTGPDGVLALFNAMELQFSPFGVTFNYLLTANGDPPEAWPFTLGHPLHNILPPGEDFKLRTPGDPHVFNGRFDTATAPGIPSYNFEIDYDVQFAGIVDPVDPVIPPVDPLLTGLQAAIGGFESGGALFPTKSPNAWFEPGFNTNSAVEFDVNHADLVYILIRTRDNVEGTSYTLNPANYTVSVTHSDGTIDPNVVPFVPSTLPLNTLWTDDFGNGIESPVVLAIASPASFMDIVITDGIIQESLLVRVNDVPNEIDEYGFIAINRSNVNSTSSQRTSNQGRVFGLVLDSQGVWDVLIAPEAIIERTIENPDFQYLGLSFDRKILDADIAYTMSILNNADIPAQAMAGLSVSPVVGFPKVWALNIGPEVKSYLKSIRDNAPANSLDGCSIDVEVLVVAKNFPNIQGVCKISIFNDFTCVFDLNLCDFFWNLNEPPVLSKQEEFIENRLAIVPRNLVDCVLISNIDNPDKSNIETDVPILLEVQNIPTFSNGNALLLIKSIYNEVVQEFRKPTTFNSIQFENCEFLSTNIPLVTKLNKEMVIDENGQEITDPVGIQNAINTLDKFLHIRPKFHFPPSDEIKELGSDEIVVFGIGYTFKNWVNGLRSDQYLVETLLKMPVGLVTQPELDFSVKFYYNQDES